MEKINSIFTLIVYTNRPRIQSIYYNPHTLLKNKHMLVRFVQRCFEAWLLV